MRNVGGTLPENRDGLGRSAEGFEHRREVEVRGAETPVELDGPAVVRDAFFVPFEFGQHIRQIEVRRRVARPQPDRLLLVPQRLVEASQMYERPAEFDVGVGVAGQQAERPTARRCRFLVSFEPAQRAPEIAVHFGQVG